MDREFIINRLIEDHIDTMRNGDADSYGWMRGLLRTGLKGFADYTDQELLQAYEDAGLDQEFFGEESNAD